jgi:integrase
MEVKFNLKDKKTSGVTLINLIFNYDKKRLKISTGHKVLVKYWNDKKQRVKELMEFTEYSTINEDLDLFENLVKQVYTSCIKDGFVPEPNIIKDELFKLKANPKRMKAGKTFWEIFEDFIEDKKESMRRGEINDVKDYTNSLRKHLKKGEERFGKPVSFAAIKEQYDGFIKVWGDYMRFEARNADGEDGLSVNTIGKQHKNLKVFLNWCFDRDIYPRFNMKHIPTEVEEVDNIYLTEEEIERIESIELDEEEEKKVRDLFLIGCETGLRFSDFSSLTKDKILNQALRVTPMKTKNSSNKKVVIPVSSRLKRIIDKYEELPRYNLKKVTDFNKVIRSVCEKAEINDLVIFEKTIANKRNEIKKRKFEEVTSHTARRTFCTLKFLDDMPAEILIKFSGHTSVRNLLRYLKIDAELAAKQYVGHFK